MNGTWSIGSLAAIAVLSACHGPLHTADSAGAPRPDIDPYLAVTKVLVAHGCSNCHAADYARVGPAMTDVASIYAGQPGAPALLATSIVNGAKGKWGEAMMPPQHQVTPAEAQDIVRTILATKAPVPGAAG